MLTPQFIVICEKAFLTAGSNNLNLIGIFSQIHTDKLPFTYPQFALVINFDTDQPGQHILHTDIMDPDGKQVAHTELPVTVTAGNMQVIANFENMQFGLSGKYLLNISLDKQLVGQRILQVNTTLSPKSQKTNLA